MKNKLIAFLIFGIAIAMYQITAGLKNPKNHVLHIIVAMLFHFLNCFIWISI